MKITAIKQQDKRKDRFSIFIDGTYAFSLGEAGLLEQKLTVGQLVDAKQLQDFKKISANDKAYANSLRYASLRARSEWELTDYLRRKQIVSPLAETILNKLSDIGLLNDEAFARAWVENRRLLKPISIRRLKQELRQKRVSDEIINLVLADTEINELENLRRLIAKKRRNSNYQDKPVKLMQYLARQGFSYEDIKTALREEAASQS
jgi:regulatory protein